MGLKDIINSIIRRNKATASKPLDQMNRYAPLVEQQKAEAASESAEPPSPNNNDPKPDKPASLSAIVEQSARSVAEKFEQQLPGIPPEVIEYIAKEVALQINTAIKGVYAVVAKNNNSVQSQMDKAIPSIKQFMEGLTPTLESIIEKQAVNVLSRQDVQQRFESLTKQHLDGAIKTPEFKSMMHGIIADIYSTPEAKKELAEICSEQIHTYFDQQMIGGLAKKIRKYRWIIYIGGAAVVGLSAYYIYKIRKSDVPAVQQAIRDYKKESDRRIKSIEDQVSSFARKSDLTDLAKREELSPFATTKVLTDAVANLSTVAAFEQYKTDMNSKIALAESAAKSAETKAAALESWKKDFLDKVYPAFTAYVRLHLDGDKEKQVEGLVSKVDRLYATELPKKSNKDDITAYGKKLDEVGTSINSLKQLVDTYEKANASLLQEIRKEKGEKQTVQQQLDTLQQRYNALQQDYQKLLPKPEIKPN